MRWERCAWKLSRRGLVPGSSLTVQTVLPLAILFVACDPAVEWFRPSHPHRLAQQIGSSP